MFFNQPYHIIINSLNSISGSQTYWTLASFNTTEADNLIMFPITWPISWFIYTLTGLFAWSIFHSWHTKFPQIKPRKENHVSNYSLVTWFSGINYSHKFKYPNNFLSCFIPVHLILWNRLLLRDLFEKVVDYFNFFKDQLRNYCTIICALKIIYYSTPHFVCGLAGVMPWSFPGQLLTVIQKTEKHTINFDRFKNIFNETNTSNIQHYCFSSKASLHW